MKILLEALIGMLISGENGNKKLRASGLGLLALFITIPVTVRYGAQVYAEEMAFRSGVRNSMEVAKGAADAVKAQQAINAAVLEEIELHGEFLRELLISKGKDPSRIESRWRLRRRLGVEPTR